ncbi:MAG: EAL domain-containing protein [Methylococcaceae bacterium]|nr:EAL domain-containing protein [Methylococcaceae bacterium]
MRAAILAGVGPKIALGATSGQWVGVGAIYSHYPVQLWTVLMIVMLLVVLLIHSMRTRAKLAQSFASVQQIAEQLQLSTHKLAYMVATSPTVLFAMKVHTNTLQTHWISDNLTRITGYTQDEALQPRWWVQHLHEEDKTRVLKESSELFLGHHLAYEYRFIHKNGEVRWIHDQQQLVCDGQGRPYEVLSAWTDITERKQEEINLRIAATAFETKEGIIITDCNNRIIRVNSAFTRLTGYSLEEVLGQTPALLSSGRQNADFYRAMWTALKENQHWEGEIWNRRKNGEIYPEWLVITAVLDEHQKVSHYVATFFDISERKAAEQSIRNLAFYDPLTNLPNRRLMLERLGLALLSCKRSNHYGALMFMDLDRFKVLNDTQGHDVGDQLLIEVAARLQSCVREDDLVARLGGDEFVVMLENLSESQTDAAIQAQTVAKKIRDAVAATYWLASGVVHDDKPLLEHHCSISIGLVLFHDYTVSKKELLNHADMAMYQAKHAGRDAIRMFDPDMQSALNERTALEIYLRHALTRNELFLYYQVQVDVQGRAVSAEALVRWDQPERGWISPANFIPLAEETGLILVIGDWVLLQGCKTLAQWAQHPATRELKLAVNVSARQFRQDHFVDQVRTALEQSGANPTKLKLEITESLIMDNLEDTVAKMHAIKQLGVGFSMDDFGTGYSSLSYLQRMPLDQLKIDQTFVRNLVEDSQDAAIIRIILALGLTVIAEGVETEVQWNYLNQCGCPVFQGYLFGKPVPLSEFEAEVFKNYQQQQQDLDKRLEQF